MAMLTILYNVLSVWLFVRAKGEPGGIGLLSISLQMLKNPLITSILAGLLVGSLWTPDTELIRVTDTFGLDPACSTDLYWWEFNAKWRT
jgi:predicted permease